MYWSEYEGYSIFSTITRNMYVLFLTITILHPSVVFNHGVVGMGDFVRCPYEISFNTLNMFLNSLAFATSGAKGNIFTPVLPSIFLYMALSIFFYMALSIFLFMALSIFFYMALSIFFYMALSIFFYMALSIFFYMALSISLYMALSIFLYMALSIFLYMALAIIGMRL